MQQLKRYKGIMKTKGTVNNLCSFFFLLPQPNQPLPRILNLREARISVLPEGEEFPYTSPLKVSLYANHSLGNIMSGPNLAEPKQSNSGKRSLKLKEPNETQQKTSNSFEDGKPMNNDRLLLEDLELLYGVTTATVAYVTGVSEHQAWKWKTAQVPIPSKYRKKLEQLIKNLRP